MHEDMRPLLSAYLDGELHGWRLLEMQTHLASCTACRDELRNLRGVSDLLKAAPEPEFTPADRFVSNLTMNLPRRPLAAQPPRPGSLAWWLVPAGLILAWFFVQTALTLTSALSAAQAANLLGNVSGLFSNGAQHSLWFTAITGFLGGQAAGTSGAALSFIDQVSLFAANMIGQLFWPVVIALAYWGWLFVWWKRRGPRPMKIVVHPASS